MCCCPERCADANASEKGDPQGSSSCPQVAHKSIYRDLQGLVVFSIDGETQTLDLREGKGKTYKGMPENGEKPDLTLTISDDNFGKLVMGKLGPQQVCCC